MPGTPGTPFLLDMEDVAEDANPVAVHSDFFLHRDGAAVFIDRRGGAATAAGASGVGGVGGGTAGGGWGDGALAWLRCMPAGGTAAMAAAMAAAGAHGQPPSDSDGESEDGDEPSTWSLYI